MTNTQHTTEQKFRVSYDSWCDEEQRYIKCSFPIYAENEKTAIRKADQKMRWMEENENDFSFLDLRVDQYPAKAGAA